MTYATLMVTPTLGRSNKVLLERAAGVADRFGAGVIGFAACRPIHVVCRDYSLPANLFEEDRKQIARQNEAAEREFRAAMANRKGRIEWRARTSIVPLAEHIARQARSADLIVVGTQNVAAEPDSTREALVGDLVMRVGRPVLLVPGHASTSTFDRVLVAWKDSREAQRAIVDALPFLAAATRVVVVEIAAQDDFAEARSSLAEVIDWLALHNIKAEAKAMMPTKANAAQLNDIADELEADLIVAGAYGYSRGRAWVMGGVTSELLTGARRCALVAH